MVFTDRVGMPVKAAPGKKTAVLLSGAGFARVIQQVAVLKQDAGVDVVVSFVHHQVLIDNQCHEIPLRLVA